MHSASELPLLWLAKQGAHSAAVLAYRRSKRRGADSRSLALQGMLQTEETRHANSLCVASGGGGDCGPVHRVESVSRLDLARSKAVMSPSIFIDLRNVYDPAIR